MRGMEITAIGLAVILGIAALVGYTLYATTIREDPGIIDVGQKFANLEGIKRDVQAIVTLSQQGAMHQIAEQGMSIVSEKNWYCGGKPSPPELNEVLYALSNETTKMVAAYINGSKFSEAFKDAYINGFACVQPYYPGAEKCGKKDSSECEYSDASALNGRIEMPGEQQLSFEGNLYAKAEPNRGLWMYTRAADAIKANQFEQFITQHQRANCRNPGPADEKWEAAIMFACEEFRKAAFDDYVEVKCEVLCNRADTNCVNEDCTVAVPKACFEGKESQAAASGPQACVNGCDGLSFQGAGGRTAKLLVKIIDHKYLVPKSDGALDPLRLIFRMDLQEGRFEHVPIDCMLNPNHLDCLNRT